MNIEKRQGIREEQRISINGMLAAQHDYQSCMLAYQTLAALDQADAAEESANALMEIAARLDSIEAEILSEVAARSKWYN